MKRFINSVLLLLTMCSNTFAQQIFDTLIDDDNGYYKYSNYCVYNEKVVTVKHTELNVNIYFLYISDTLKLESTLPLFLNSKGVYYYDDKENILHTIYIKSGEHKTIKIQKPEQFPPDIDTAIQHKASFDLEIVTENYLLFGYGFLSYIYDIATNTFSLLDMPPFDKAISYLNCFNKGKNIAFYSFYADEDLVFEKELVYFNLISGTTTQRIPIEFSTPCPITSVEITGNYLFICDSIVDKSLNKIGNFLKKRSYPIGYNYLNDTLHSFNISTNIGFYSYIIAYRPTLALEQSLYDIYHNQALNQAYFNSLGEWECKVLQQMVYAKYNYKFPSKYYAVLFDMFLFYKPDVSDITAVESQFTTTDRQNLQLIEQQLQKYPKHR